MICKRCGIVYIPRRFEHQPQPLGLDYCKFCNQEHQLLLNAIEERQKISTKKLKDELLKIIGKSNE